MMQDSKTNLQSVEDSRENQTGNLDMLVEVIKTEYYTSNNEDSDEHDSAEEYQINESDRRIYVKQEHEVKSLSEYNEQCEYEHASDSDTVRQRLELELPSEYKTFGIKPQTVAEVHSQFLTSQGGNTKSTPGGSTNSTPGASTKSTPGASTKRTPGASTKRTPGASTNITPGASTNSTPGGSIRRKGRHRIADKTHSSRGLEKIESEGNLLTSGKSQSRSRPYICPVCNKATSSRVSLGEHMRTHTGEKPYSCDICHKKFAVPHNLDRHKLTHIANSPFKCKICSMNFKKENFLKNHMICHTGVKA